MGLRKELKGGLPFRAGNWWFDEKGHEHLNEPLSLELEKWLLRQTGQVKVELKPHLIEVTWDTHHVHPEAIQAIMDQLEEMNMDVKVHIHFFYHGWSYEKYQDPFWAMERIGEIQECRTISLIHDTQISECRLSDIAYAGSRLKRGYKCWEKTGARFVDNDSDDLSKIVPYTIMFRPDNREENLVFSWVGMHSIAARVNSYDWLSEAVGKVTHQSFGNENQNFVEKINLDIVRTMMTGEPVYQHIRTLITVEDHEPFWMGYQRLLTRHILKDGGFAVVSDVYPTQYLDIPLVGTP